MRKLYKRLVAAIMLLVAALTATPTTASSKGKRIARHDMFNSERLLNLKNGTYTIEFEADKTGILAVEVSFILLLFSGASIRTLAINLHSFILPAEQSIP